MQVWIEVPSKLMLRVSVEWYLAATVDIFMLFLT